MQNNNPSIRPENNGTIAGAINHAFSKMLQDIAGVIPAEVVSVTNGSTTFVSVQPLIKIKSTDGSENSRALIPSVPVCQIGGGGYLLNVELKQGDQGLLIACDRDISNYLNSMSQSAPATNRKKDFADSFFLPLALGIDNPNNNGITLQNYENTINLSINSSGISILGETTIDGNVTIEGDLIIDGKIRVVGDINCGGNITAAGNITPNTPLPP